MEVNWIRDLFLLRLLIKFSCFWIESFLFNSIKILELLGLQKNREVFEFQVFVTFQLEKGLL